MVELKKIINPFSVTELKNGLFIVTKEIETGNKKNYVPYSSEKQTEEEAIEIMEDLYYEYCLNQHYDI